MPKPADFEWRRTIAPNSTGGGIDQTAGGLIDPRGENNIFAGTNANEAVVGSVKYRCIAVKYIGPETPIKENSFTQFKDTPDKNTKVEWTFDTVGSPYQYGPSFDATGSTFDTTPDTAALDLTQFTVCAWFRTISVGGGDHIIVCKGGIGSDVAGDNNNYIINLDTNGKILAGFETGAGVDNYVTSPLAYNDGRWHFACVTYDLVTVKLYMDGVSTPVATLSTTSTPEVNAQPVNIGRNSYNSSNFFTGQIDEVRVYNRAVLAAEMFDIFDNVISVTGLLIEKKFGADDGLFIAQELASETTAPASAVWQPIVNTTPTEPNVGEMVTNQYYYVFIKYFIAANSPSIDNDLSIFRHWFGIGPGQPGGGGEGGGSGGDDGTPGSANPVTIVHTGDTDCKSKTEEVVDYIADDVDPDLVLIAGDFVYSSSTSCIFDVMKKIDDNQGSDIRLEIAIGNHDTGSKKDDEVAHFKTGKSYYHFDIENIHVLVLDSENSPTSTAQKDFATTSLKNARADKDIDWIFVMFHHPIYTADSDHDPDEANMRSFYHPLFDTYKVDLCLQSHVHNIQRTYPIKNNADNNPSIKQSGGGPYTGGNGTIFVISGDGGHDSSSALYPLDNTPSYNAYQDRSKTQVHIIKTTNLGKTLTGTFTDLDGKINHTYVINR
jgi:hypothetical protein